MKECIREREIERAIAGGRWAETSSAELRSHAEACPVCRDLAVVAGALFAEAAEVEPKTVVPPAGLVWWRAQLRARQEAARTAERPLKVAHSLAAASVAGVAAALIVGMMPSVREMLAPLVSVPMLEIVVGAVAALVTVANLAVYFVVSDK